MILLWIALFGYIVLFYLKEIFQRRKKVAPGPWPLPVIGNLHQIAMAHSRIDLALAKLSEQYGEIYRTFIGSTETVILSSYEAIRQVLSNKEAVGRDLRGTLLDRNKGKYSGIIFNEGPNWEIIRTWTIKNLKDYGFNKSSLMEASIADDIESMFEKIDDIIASDRQGILNVGDCILVPVFKFMWKLLVGHCTSEDDDMLAGLIHKSEEMAKSGIFGAGIVNAFPILRHVFPNWTGHKIMMDFNYEACKVAERLLKDVRDNHIETPANFIEAYAKKMDQVKYGDDPALADCFNELEFSVLFMDLVQAGSDTTGSYLTSLFLFMVHFPEIQNKIYEEIQQNVPQSRTLLFTDSKSMIYTQAAMLEVHRHSKVVQNFIPRKVLKEILYKDYIIKKGTVILTDLQTPYNCDKTWKDPENFRPERFIGPNGDLINKQLIIPFGVGKRNCPGENLAEVSSFLFFASTVRKYKLSPVPDEPLPRRDMNVAFTSKPYPFKAVFSKRQ